MRKGIVSILFVFASIVSNAQVAKIITEVNEAGDVASFELDCTKKFPVLANNLKYNITRHEFKGADKINTYHVLLVMDGFYTKTLNKTMQISVVLSNGKIIGKTETIENDGYFDGACTVTLKSPEEVAEMVFNKIIVHADKDVIYTITEKNMNIFKTNLKNIVEAK